MNNGPNATSQGEGAVCGSPNKHRKVYGGTEPRLVKKTTYFYDIEAIKHDVLDYSKMDAVAAFQVVKYIH